MNFGLELLFLVWQEVDLDVGVGGAAHVERGQFLALDHRHRQVVGVEVVLQLKQTNCERLLPAPQQTPAIGTDVHWDKNKARGCIDAGDADVLYLLSIGGPAETRAPDH